MGRDTLTGSRIRERRIVCVIRQAELAKRVGISASYLNLIEHNRRRIGGKLLLDIARELDVEPSLLSEGAEVALIEQLRETSADNPSVPAEIALIEDFAARFPGWARLVTASHDRVKVLEQTVASLSDRLRHDPQMAASMHEVLSVVTAIRSTASILADSQQLTPEWQSRFHRNINEDSKRLAESSKQLVNYLDSAEDKGKLHALPQDELEEMLQAHDYHFVTLENGRETPAEIIAGAGALQTTAARAMALTVLKQYERDTRRLPLDPFRAAVKELGTDPVALAERFHTSLGCVFRRLVTMPRDPEDEPIGLVVCDGAGTLIFRKPIDGFDLPRFSAACPRLLLFQALSRPFTPMRKTMTMTGRDSLQFDCFAVAEPAGTKVFNEDPLFNSYMLIRPVETRQEFAPEVGSTCRVCPSVGCEVRREPSVLLEGI